MEFRCTCSARPLLAIARLTDAGERFLHIRIFKRDRIYGEIVVEQGTVRLRCRSCLRWYVVNVKRDRVAGRPEHLPSSLEVPTIRRIS